MFPLFFNILPLFVKKTQGSPDQNVLELGNNAWELGLATVPKIRGAGDPR